MTQHTGHRIRKLRKVRLLSAQQLAHRAKMSLSIVEKYEAGSRVPTPAAIAALARALQVSPAQITGQPYMNGAEADEQAQTIVPDLRRIMLTFDSPDDLGVPARPLPVLAAEMDHVAQMRQDGRYVAMGPLLPGLLSELTHVALSAREPEKQQAYWWLARAYRAANSLAHKLGYHDLSITAIERVQWAADRSGDPLMQVTAAYLRAGAMVRAGTYASARRVLEGLEDEIERLAPEQCPTEAHLALQGAVLLKLSVLEARDGNPDRAWARLETARTVAAFGRDADTTHYEMSFGPTNIRIHEIAALIDLGDTGAALARLREWGAEQDQDEWELPEGTVAERASHHHIDVAAAKLAEGDRHGAFASLQEARHLSPNHTRFHPTVRSTAGALVRLDRSQDNTVAGLARWAGVANG